MRAQKKRAQIIWALKEVSSRFTGVVAHSSPCGVVLFLWQALEAADDTCLSPAIYRKVRWPRRVITPPHLN